MVLNNTDEGSDSSPTMDSSPAAAKKSSTASVASMSLSSPVRLHSRITSHRPTPALSVVQETVLKVEAGEEESDADGRLGGAHGDTEVVVVGANESSALTNAAGPTWDADSLDSEIGLINANGQSGVDGEDIKECNYDINPTFLFQGIQAHEWEWVLDLFQTKETSYFAECTAKFFESIKSATGGGEKSEDEEEEKDDRPIDEQVQTWVTRRNQPTGDVRWRMLPLHAALMHRAPYNVISLLLKKYPTAAQCRDDRGMLPLHLAFRHDHGDDVLGDLLEVYPHAMEVRDLKGRMPLECCPQPTSTASGEPNGGSPVRRGSSAAAPGTPNRQRSGGINNSSGGNTKEDQEAAAQQLARAQLIAKRNAVLKTYVQHAISTERSYTLQDSAMTLDERERALWTEYGNAIEVLKGQHQAKVQSKDQEIARLREGEKELLDKVKELSAALEEVTSKKGMRSISPFHKTSSKQGSIGMSSSGLYGGSGIGSSSSRATPAPVASADSVEVETSSRYNVEGAAIVGGAVAAGAVATVNNNVDNKEGKEEGDAMSPPPVVQRNLQPPQEEDEGLACAVPIKEDDDETNKNKKKSKSKMKGMFSFFKRKSSKKNKTNKKGYDEITAMRSTDDGDAADDAAGLKQIKSATSSEKHQIVTGAEQSLMAVQHHHPNDRNKSADEIELEVSHDHGDATTTATMVTTTASNESTKKEDNGSNDEDGGEVPVVKENRSSLEEDVDADHVDDDSDDQDNMIPVLSVDFVDTRPVWDQEV